MKTKTEKPQANWSALWSLDPAIAGPYTYTTHREYYPGVLFIVRLHELKGAISRTQNITMD